LGNVTAIAVGALVSIIGSLLRPENFNFEVMKQKILVVDDRIRSMIEHDTDEKFLKKAARFSYKYAIALTLVLVIVWPLPLYFSGYVFSSLVYYVWIGIAVAWAAGAAGVVIVLPLVESRRGIAEVLRRITALGMADEPPGTEDTADEKRPQYDSRKILVAVDGSKESLSALTYASYLFEESQVRIFLLNVIEWADESDGSADERLASEMEEEGKRMLRSVMIPKKMGKYERIVKLGDPATKIAETAEKLGVDMIVMGRKGLGGSQSDVGHVTAKVLQSTTKPVVLL
jgi:nucleotide-binding universal stress UspA family protein